MEQTDSLRSNFQGNDPPSLMELVSLQRQQLNVLQSIDVKSDQSRLASLSTGGQALSAAGLSAERIASLPQSPAISAAVSYAQNRLDSFQVSTTASPNQKQQQAMQFGSNLGTSAIGAVGGAGRYLTGLLPFGDVIGGTAVGIATGAAVERLNRESTYSQYVQRTSGQSVNIFNSRNRFGTGGFTISESRKLGRTMDLMSTMNFLNTEEMQNFAMTANDNGLLVNTKNTREYASKLNQLTKDAKAMAQALNASIDEIGEFYGSLNKLVGTVRDGNKVLMQGKITGGFLGMDGSLVAQNVLNQTQNIVSGTGLSGENVLTGTSRYTYAGSRLFTELQEQGNNLTRDQRTALNYMRNIGKENIGAAYEQSLGKILENSNASAVIAAAYSTDENGNIVFDANKASKLNSMNLSEILAEGQGTLAGANASSKLSFLQNQAQFAYNDMSDLQLRQVAKAAASSYAEASGGKLDEKTVLTQMFGLSDAEASLISEMNNISDYAMSTQGNISNVMTSQQEYRSNRGTLGENIKRNVGLVGRTLNTLNPLYQAGNVVTQVGSNVNQTWDTLWYGKQYSAEELTLQSDFWLLSNSEREERVQNIQTERDDLFSNISKLSDDAQKSLASIGISTENTFEIKENSDFSLSNLEKTGSQIRKPDNFLNSSGITAKNKSDYEYAYRSIASGRGEEVVGGKMSATTQQKKVTRELLSQGITSETAQEVLDSGAISKYGKVQSDTAFLQMDAAKIQNVILEQSDTLNIFERAGMGLGTADKGVLLEDAYKKYANEFNKWEEDNKNFGDSNKFAKNNMLLQMAQSDQWLANSYNVALRSGEERTLTGEQINEMTASGKIDIKETMNKLASTQMFETKDVLNDVLSSGAAQEDPVQAVIAKRVDEIGDWVQVIAQKIDPKASTKLYNPNAEKDGKYGTQQKDSSLSSLYSNVSS